MNETYNNELQHYGVLGMKWGVRRNASKAFAKASRKADKLDAKAKKTALKAAKLDAKNLKRYKVDRVEEAVKLRYKAAKLEKKGQKWAKKMEKTFAEVNINDVSKEHRDKGRKYVYMLNKK